MTDFDSTSYVQGRNLDDFSARYNDSWAKSIPWKTTIPRYPNIASAKGVNKNVLMHPLGISSRTNYFTD